MPSQRRNLLSTILTAFVSLSFALPLLAQNESGSGHLSDQPQLRGKAPEVLTSLARKYLAGRDGDTATVWVCFTDKGIRTRDDFRSLAASVSLSDKVMKRRAKVGADRILFADLPVVPAYLDAVVSRGGKLRRVSRWLNAASYRIPADKLDAVAGLPFVAEIKPVAAFRTEHPEIGDARISPPSESLAPDALNYGPSYTQLNQVSVPAVHSKGYAGQGVTLAIFDTGFRKTHEAFAQHYAEGRVLAEYDFVFNDTNTANEAGDLETQWNHGTYIWSVSGGLKDGKIYGPAYRANFLLAKTEDLRSETPVEEDNWVAALEWADSLGADVVTSSLAYSDWYVYADVDGQTATITIAANTAAGLGIVVCNAMGNEGPSAGTLHPPADAFDILACGAVTSTGGIASFSSRGPTYDGRTKPEVCAQGVATYAAFATADNTYGTVNGTSLSTPIVAGTACLLVQARPTFTPQMIRQAIMETASNAASPNNDYGWGIVNINEALNWGANFSADTTIGDAPFTVQFTDLSTLATPSYLWHFGDGDSSTVQNPSHEFTVPGVYSVSLTIETAFGPITSTRDNFILALGDTLTFGTDSAFGGHEIVSSVYLTNSQPLTQILIPFEAADSSIDITFDSVAFGARTAYFDRIQYQTYDPTNNRFALSLVAGSSAPPLDPGTGEIMKVYWSTAPWSVSGQANWFDTSGTTIQKLTLFSPQITYKPSVQPGELRIITVDRGDINYDQARNLADVTRLIAFVYLAGEPPVSLATGDVNDDQKVNLSDITKLIGFVYLGGSPPAQP